jgi:hypothetical protein
MHTHPKPDGRCHASLASVLVRGCEEQVQDGFWSCALHAHQLHLRGRALIAAAAEKGQGGAPNSNRSTGRDRTGSSEKTRDGGGWS